MEGVSHTHSGIRGVTTPWLTKLSAKKENSNKKTDMVKLK